MVNNAINLNNAKEETNAYAQDVETSVKDLLGQVTKIDNINQGKDAVLTNPTHLAYERTKQVLEKNLGYVTEVIKELQTRTTDKTWGKEVQNAINDVANNLFSTI